MTKRFYLDTCIWMDYLEDRNDGLKPLGEFAFQFLRACKRCHCIIIYSEPVLFELKQFRNQWEEVKDDFGEILIEVPVTEGQFHLAKKIARERNLPFNDVFHTIIAKDQKAVIITRDKHFKQLTDLVEIKQPEEVIFDH